MTVVVAAAAAAAVSGQRPLVPQGGGGCKTDWDCSLGGTCAGISSRGHGTCKCDAWFTGQWCDLLNLQAPEDTERGLCHSGFESYHSWGGRALPATETTVTNAADGTAIRETSTTWHLYASFMCAHNSLSKWTTMSSSGHFVGDSPIGPFSFSAEQCVGDICTPTVVPWSHNTVANTAATPGKDQWQIWHIGDGVVNASVWSPCFNKSQIGPGWVPPAVAVATATAAAPPPPPNPGNRVYVSYGATPNGPWTRANDNTPVPIRFPADGAWPQGATNPSPLVMPDGSVNLYFTNARDDNWCGLESNCIGMAKSKNGWEGPYEPVTAPLVYPESEDAHVFRDPRGNYHMLTNVNTGHARCAAGVECGGHAWSRDGTTFSNLTVGAFGPTVTFANGTVWRNAYAERPLVSQAEDGTPLAFYVGLGRSSYLDCCNWPMLFCTGKPGEICGPTLQPN